jgi:hypothetical protein
MINIKLSGVLPVVSTPFHDDVSIDEVFTIYIIIICAWNCIDYRLLL